MKATETSTDNDFETQVVTAEGETVAQLREAFDAVANVDHWKNPWAAKVPAGLVGLVCRAVEFFHADVPTVHGVEPITGLVLITGRGYQAW
jgi:hypothetical protein